MLKYLPPWIAADRDEQIRKKKLKEEEGDEEGTTTAVSSSCFGGEGDEGKDDELSTVPADDEQPLSA